VAVVAGATGFVIALEWTSIFFLTASFDELRCGTSGTGGGSVASGGI
jgi:hypothetical protein